MKRIPQSLGKLPPKNIVILRMRCGTELTEKVPVLNECLLAEKKIMQHSVSNYYGSFCSSSPKVETSTNVCPSISLFYCSYVAQRSQETGCLSNGPFPISTTWIFSESPSRKSFVSKEIIGVKQLGWNKYRASTWPLFLCFETPIWLP